MRLSGSQEQRSDRDCNDDPPVEQPEELLRTLGADDVKWINQCIADNKGGASDAVIRKYCFCMNEKMDANETRSITGWEKIQPRGGRARPGYADGGANARR